MTLHILHLNLRVFFYLFISCLMEISFPSFLSLLIRAWLDTAQKSQRHVIRLKICTSSRWCIEFLIGMKDRISENFIVQQFSFPLGDVVSKCCWALFPASTLATHWNHLEILKIRILMLGSHPKGSDKGYHLLTGISFQRVAGILIS